VISLGLLALVTLGLPRPARASGGDGRCRPAAKLAGDSSVVAPIGRVLAARGISADGQAACRQVAVNIRPLGTGYALVIQDAEGRTARRRLPSPEAAALVIESWTRADLAAPLQTETPDTTWDDDPGDPAPQDLTPALQAEREAEPTPTPPAPTMPLAMASATPANEARLSSDAPLSATNARESQPVDVAAVATAVAPAPGTKAAALVASAVALRLAGETAVAPDRSASWGARGGFCLRAGPLCVGLLGRYARTILGPLPGGIFSQPALPPDLDRRSELDLQLSAEWPLHLGPVQIAPALGVGAGQASSTWRITNPDGTPNARGRDRYAHNGHGSPSGYNDRDRHNGSRPPSASASTTTAPIPTAAGAASSGPTTATVNDDEQRLLAEAGVTLSVPLGRGLAIDLGMSLARALARFGNAESPLTQLHGGLGLRYGSR
jgi:hypothetical protein